MQIDWQVCTEVTSDSASFDLVLEVDSGTDAMCSEHEVSRAENAGTFRIIGDGNRLHTHLTHTCNYATNEATQSGTRNAVHCPAHEICVDF